MEAVNTLFRKPTRNRPTPHDDDVKRKAAEELAAEIRRMPDYDDGDPESMIEQLMECYDRDGYTYASNLESRHSWMPDEDLVEVLRGDQRHYVCRDAVKAWVKEQGITPGHKIGDVVQVRLHIAYKAEKFGITIDNDGSSLVEGTIIRLDEQTAEYTVNVPALQMSPTSGYVVAFEDVDHD